MFDSPFNRRNIMKLLGAGALAGVTAPALIAGRQSFNFTDPAYLDYKTPW